MATLVENVQQAITDFSSIKNAIETVSGETIVNGTKTSTYASLISNLSANGDTNIYPIVGTFYIYDLVQETSYSLSTLNTISGNGEKVLTCNNEFIICGTANYTYNNITYSIPVYFNSLIDDIKTFTLQYKNGSSYTNYIELICRKTYTNIFENISFKSISANACIITLDLICIDYKSTSLKDSITIAGSISSSSSSSSSES